MDIHPENIIQEGKCENILRTKRNSQKQSKTKVGQRRTITKHTINDRKTQH